MVVGRPKGGTPWNKGLRGMTNNYPSQRKLKGSCLRDCECNRHRPPANAFQNGVSRPDVSENMRQRHTKGLSHSLTSEERALSGRMKGKHHSPEAKAKISAYMESVYGPDRVGKPYPENWDEVRQVIMKRDERQCQICFGYGRLHVHHKDEDKSNCDYDNLVTLCASCHMRGHRLNKWPW